MSRLHTFTIEGSSGRFRVTWCGYQEGRPYLVTSGCGAYLVDLSSGVCDGVEGLSGKRVRLVPGSLRRLRRLAGDKPPV